MTTNSPHIIVVGAGAHTQLITRILSLEGLRVSEIAHPRMMSDTHYGLDHLANTLQTTACIPIMDIQSFEEQDKIEQSRQEYNDFIQGVNRRKNRSKF